MNFSNNHLFSSDRDNDLKPAFTFIDEETSSNMSFNPDGLKKSSSENLAFNARHLTESCTKAAPASKSESSLNATASANGINTDTVHPFIVGQNIPPIQYKNCNVNAGKVVEYGMLRTIDLQVAESKSQLAVKEEAEKIKNRVNASIEKDTLSIRIEFNTEGYLILRHERIGVRDRIVPIIDHRPEAIELYVSDSDPDDRLIHVRWIKRTHSRDMYFSENCSPLRFQRELSILGVHLNRLKGIKSLVEDVIEFLAEQSASTVVTIPTKYGLFTANGESVYIRPGDKEYKLWEEYKKKCVR